MITNISNTQVAVIFIGSFIGTYFYNCELFNVDGFVIIINNAINNTFSFHILILLKVEKYQLYQKSKTVLFVSFLWPHMKTT